MFEIINILLFLMSGAGPTPVAGTNGTTAAFLAGRSPSIHAQYAASQHASTALEPKQFGRR